MEENLNYDFSKGKQSSRHHYIPQFLLNGFKNSEGKLYVFDKQKNRILSKPKPPKSIFFEKDRNTIEFSESQTSSVIEDYFFSVADSDSSKIVRYFQKEAIEKIEFDEKNTGVFLLFLLLLFWRIPKTDAAFERLWKQTEIITPDLDPELIKSDQAFKKVHRSGLFKPQSRASVRLCGFNSHHDNFQNNSNHQPYITCHGYPLQHFFQQRALWRHFFVVLHILPFEKPDVDQETGYRQKGNVQEEGIIPPVSRKRPLVRIHARRLGQIRRAGPGR